MSEWHVIVDGKHYTTKRNTGVSDLYPLQGAKRVIAKFLKDKNFTTLELVREAKHVEQGLTWVVKLNNKWVTGPQNNRLALYTQLQAQNLIDTSGPGYAKNTYSTAPWTAVQSGQTQYAEYLQETIHSAVNSAVAGGVSTRSKRAAAQPPAPGPAKKRKKFILVDDYSSDEEAEDKLDDFVDEASSDEEDEGDDDEVALNKIQPLTNLHTLLQAAQQPFQAANSDVPLDSLAEDTEDNAAPASVDSEVTWYAAGRDASAPYTSLLSDPKVKAIDITKNYKPPVLASDFKVAFDNLTHVPAIPKSRMYDRVKFVFGKSARVLDLEEWKYARSKFLAGLDALAKIHPAARALILDDIRVYTLGMDFLHHGIDVQKEAKLLEHLEGFKGMEWQNYLIPRADTVSTSAYQVYTYFGRLASFSDMPFYLQQNEDGGIEGGRQMFSNFELELLVKYNSDKSEIKDVMSTRDDNADEAFTNHGYEQVPIKKLLVQGLLDGESDTYQLRVSGFNKDTPSFLKVLIAHFKELVRLEEDITETARIAVLNDLVDALTPAAHARSKAYSTAATGQGMLSFLLGDKVENKSEKKKEAGRAIANPWSPELAKWVLLTGVFQDPKLTTDRNAHQKKINQSMLASTLSIHAIKYQALIDSGYRYFLRQVDRFERALALNSGVPQGRRIDPDAKSEESKSSRQKAQEKFDEAMQGWLEEHDNKPQAMALFQESPDDPGTYVLQGGGALNQRVRQGFDFNQKDWEPKKNKPMWANMLVWLAMVSGCRRIELVKWSDFGYITREFFMKHPEVMHDPLVDRSGDIVSFEQKWPDRKWNEEVGLYYRRYILQFGIAKQGFNSEDRTERSGVNDRYIIRPLLGLVTGQNFWRVHRMMAILLEQHLRFQYVPAGQKALFSRSARPFTDYMQWTKEKDLKWMQREMDAKDLQELWELHRKKSPHGVMPAANLNPNTIAQHVLPHLDQKKKELPFLRFTLSNAWISNAAMTRGGTNALHHIMGLYTSGSAALLHEAKKKAPDMPWKQTRAVYANMAYHLYAKHRNMSLSYFISRALGHSFSDTATARFYTTISVKEEVFSIGEAESIMFVETMNRDYELQLQRLDALYNAAMVLHDQFQAAAAGAAGGGDDDDDDGPHPPGSRAAANASRERVARAAFRAIFSPNQRDVKCKRGHLHRIKDAQHLRNSGLWTKDLHFGARWGIAYSHALRSKNPLTHADEDAFIADARRQYDANMTREKTKKKAAAIASNTSQSSSQ